MPHPAFSFIKIINLDSLTGNDFLSDTSLNLFVTFFSNEHCICWKCSSAGMQTIDVSQALFMPIGASVSLLIMFLFFDSLQVIFAICTASKNSYCCSDHSSWQIYVDFFRYLTFWYFLSQPRITYPCTLIIFFKVNFFLKITIVTFKINKIMKICSYFNSYIWTYLFVWFSNYDAFELTARDQYSQIVWQPMLASSTLLVSIDFSRTDTNSNAAYLNIINSVGDFDFGILNAFVRLECWKEWSWNCRIVFLLKIWH